MKIVPDLTIQHTSYNMPPSTKGSGGRAEIRASNSSTPPKGREKGIQEKEGATKDTQTSELKGPRPLNELDRQALQELLQLKKRDQEVKQHEMAHIAAGGPYVRGGAHFQYKRGPDGRRYAVAGEVSIDTSPEKDPRATLQKMRTVQRAALAPAHPSQQDRRVAAQAAAKAIQAMVEIMKEAQAEKLHSNPQKDNSPHQEVDNGRGRIDLYA